MPIIENSVSSRATCKICKNKIDKDIPRVGIESIFRRDGNEYISYKWHHLECVVKNQPDKLIGAELRTKIPSDVEDEKEKVKIQKTLLSKEQVKTVEKVISSVNKSGSAVKGITKVKTGNKKVHVEAFVKKKMSSRMLETAGGKEAEGVKVYVEFENETRTVLLFGNAASVDLKAGDHIVIVNGMSHIANNDSIEIHVLDDGKVLVNPDQSQIDEETGGIELYTSQEWERPKDKFCEFDIAPSGRARCGHCDKKIEKGEIKILKAVFIETPKMKVSGHTSYHLGCIIDDPDGLEVVREASTRLSPDMIEGYYNELKSLLQKLPESKTKDLLELLLEN